MKNFALFIIALISVKTSLSQATRNVNPTYFAVKFDEKITSGGGGDIPLSKLYSLNTANITIEDRSIKINKTGLYHFDYYIHVKSLSSKAPSITLYLAQALPGWPLIFVKEEPIPAFHADSIFSKSWNFSVDIHINAPATVHLVRNVKGSTSTTTIDGVFLGRLIE